MSLTPKTDELVLRDWLCIVLSENSNIVIINAAKDFDVYLESYIPHSKHPDDEGAEEFYDNLYGKLFSLCPKLKGISLSDEAQQFHSHDPNALTPKERTVQDNTRHWFKTLRSHAPKVVNKTIKDVPEDTSFIVLKALTTAG